MTPPVPFSNLIDWCKRRVIMKPTRLVCAIAAALLTFPLAAENSLNVFDVVRGGDLRALKSGLQKPEVAKARDSKGVPLVMYTAAFGSPEALRMVLDAGADVNAKNSFDATALMWAA